MSCIGAKAASVARIALAIFFGMALALVVAGTGVAVAAAPAGFHVVAHPQNPAASVDRDFLADAFLKKAVRWPGGDTIQPVDLRADAPARERFSEHVLRRSIAAVRSYWQQRIFTGRGVPPPELESDAAVIQYVKMHPGAVGYVSERADVGAVKIIAVQH
jgi:ABC-type phosphate transport system substrate-binding protein